MPDPITKQTLKERPLWESDHPYYCEEQNYYAHRAETVVEHANWQEFIDGIGGNTMLDNNLLFRWDWSPYGEGDRTKGVQQFYCHWMLQRKGIYLTTITNVTPDEEPLVREWLADRWEKVRELWAPLSGWEPNDG